MTNPDTSWGDLTDPSHGHVDSHAAQIARYLGKTATGEPTHAKDHLVSVVHLD